MDSVSTYIHHQTAVIFTTSGDVNTHSSSLKMATVPKEQTMKKCVLSFVFLLPHPPYSPDLEPSDFHLLSKTKKHFRGQRFHSNEDVQNEVKKWLRAQDAFFSMKDLIN
jgi:hypothetical protein